MLTYRLKGVSPLLMHNGHLVDPTNPFTLAMKEITAKRKKTEADLEELKRREFLGGLYQDKEGTIGLPAEVIMATVINGAKKNKNGPAVKAGVFTTAAFFPLDHLGSPDPNELWLDPDFRLVSKARVGQQSVMRTRPKFDVWSVDVSFDIMEDLVSESTLHESLVAAGKQVGLGDWRPQYGRFLVERLSA